MPSTDDWATAVVALCTAIIISVAFGLYCERHWQAAELALRLEKDERAWCETRLGICLSTCGPP